jgi:hypothetical protein
VPVDLPDELRQDAGARQDRDNVAYVAPSGVP